MTTDEIESSGYNALLVYPEFPPSYWGFRYAVELLGKRAAMPPLGLITIAGLFPERYRLRLVDMNVSPLTEEDLQWADLVFTSTMVVQRRSLGRLIERCRRRSLPVVVGGPHPTSYGSEISGASHYVLDEVEEILPRFLRDWEEGNARKVYRPEGKPDISAAPVPRFDLLDLDAYGSMALQFSRGCPFDCEFCDITKLFGRKPRTKSDEQMQAELDGLYEAGWRGSVFVVDDNFIGNKRDALRVLPAITRWQRERGHPFSFFTEASVNLARLDPLMDAMVDAGFTMVFLGIESPNPEALHRTRKVQNTSRDADEFLLSAVRTIQRKGIEVTGGFILGLDGDGPEVFDAQIDFVQEAGIPVAMVGLLTALRGTDLYARLREEGRLLGETSGNNVDIALNFVPELDRSQLLAGYRRVLRTLYEPSLESYFRRCRTLLRNLAPTPHGVRSVGWPELRAAALSLWRQIPSRQGPAYAKFLVRTLISRPRFLPEAIRLGIMGYHFQRLTTQILAADEFREAVKEEYDRVESLMVDLDRDATGVPALRRSIRALRRRLGRLYRRLQPDFRTPFARQWQWIQDTARDLLSDSELARRIHAAVPRFREIFDGQTWCEHLPAVGYSRVEALETRTEARSVALAPTVGHDRLRGCLETFLRELGVQVLGLRDQLPGLQPDDGPGGDSDPRSREGALTHYLESLAERVDTLVVPVVPEIGELRDSIEVHVRRAATGARDLPRVVYLACDRNRRWLREQLLLLGRSLTEDGSRIEEACERALVFV